MKQLSRQEKRAATRLIVKKRSQWRVPSWQPMKLIETRENYLDPNIQDYIFKNDKYIVIKRNDSKDIIHLSIRNMANSTDIPWTHKQQIKNDICGREREAVELYPSMSRIVDAANQYHLWVFPSDYIVPVGFEQIFEQKAA